jgi:hypothetical protein
MTVYKSAGDADQICSGFFLFGKLCLLMQGDSQHMRIGALKNYCPASWIGLKVVSFDRSLLNGEARRFFSKL